MSITYMIPGVKFNTDYLQDCKSTGYSNPSGDFEGIDSWDCSAFFNVEMVTEVIIDLKTIDKYEITNGMKVWDYDLERVTVDISDMYDEKMGNYYRMPDTVGQHWFKVKTESGYVKTMSDTRVWLYHPHTGERA